VSSTAMRKSILRNPQEQANRTRDYSPHAALPAPAPRFASARASYPVFLSLHDTLKLQIGWAWGGLVDAFRWDVVIGLMTRNVCSLLPFFSASVCAGLLTVIVAILRSARMRSSLSCLMAYPCSRYMSLTFFCTLYLYREVKRVGRAYVYSRGLGFIGALGGSIVSCGSYQSLACRSISMCVIYAFFLCVHSPLFSPTTTTTTEVPRERQVGVAYISLRSFCRPRGALLLPSELLPCDMVSRTLMLE
jgi:hypothetical protein